MKYKLTLFILTLYSCCRTGAQTTINGPTCVVPGIEYQYLISSTDTSTTGINICLNGGVYFGSTDSCLHDSVPPFILVMWNSGIDTASISWNSPSLNTITPVSFSSPLQGGLIDSSYLFQTVGNDSSVSNIQCSAATGGNCSPSYTYQWQQSPNNVDWTDINEATNQNLDVPVTVNETTYIRRAVKETTSGTVGYSNSATINVPLQTGMVDLKDLQKHSKIYLNRQSIESESSSFALTIISQKLLENL